MLDPTPTVFIVDADVSIRETVEDLVLEAGFRAAAFASASEFLESPCSAAPCCLVLDVGLPDLSGLELQARVASEHSEMPVIFLTSSRDIQIAVRAMKAGALEFLCKPFEGDSLIGAVCNAIDRSRTMLAGNAGLRALRTRHDLLSPREREVMALVVSGHLNKQIGWKLGISEITVKVHRGRVMKKMLAASLAHLVDMARRLGITPPLPGFNGARARTSQVYEAAARA
jgi:FixJ family two-component response regulator